jgi:hypothetical protein
MKVVKPLDVNHEVILIPRHEPLGLVKFDLINEVTKEIYTFALEKGATTLVLEQVNNLFQDGSGYEMQDGSNYIQKATTLDTYIYLNGIFSFNFEHTFLENDKYTLVFSDELNVLYRDKLIATTQDTQSFKSSNDLYYYE